MNWIKRVFRAFAIWLGVRPVVIRHVRWHRCPNGAPECRFNGAARWWATEGDLQDAVVEAYRREGEDTPGGKMTLDGPLQVKFGGWSIFLF